MKGNKWSRLVFGVGLLGMLFIFQGTSGHEAEGCALCFLDYTDGLGYLQVYNNTPYNIMVSMQGRGYTVGPFKIKSTPNFIRTDLSHGAYRVHVFVCTPTPDQTPVYYKFYRVDIPGNFQTVSLTVTTPLNYIPIPK